MTYVSVTETTYNSAVSDQRESHHADYKRLGFLLIYQMNSTNEQRVKPPDVYNPHGDFHFDHLLQNCCK